MTPQNKCRSRGAAMSEMVLVVPFFLVVLSLLFYLGRGMIRVQHTQVVDRYEAWRATSGAPEPAANNADRNGLLNQAFFGGKANNLEFESHNVHVDVFDDLYAERVENDPRQTPAGTDLAHRMHMNNSGYYLTRVKSEHDLSARLWNRLDGAVYHSHIRIGHDWSFATIWRVRADDTWTPVGGGGRMESPLNETYFTPLNDALTQGELATRLRGLYNSVPHYVGPTVTF